MSRASRTRGLSMTLAVGVGLVLAPPARAQMQPPQGQQGQQQPKPQAPDLQQIWQMHKMQMRARIAGAMQQLRTACDDEMRNFCGTVTPGEGRLLLCMQAHEDKISRQCELALLETSRSIGGAAVRRVENFAQTCWQDIQTHCSGAGGSVAAYWWRIAPRCRRRARPWSPPCPAPARSRASCRRPSRP